MHTDVKLLMLNLTLSNDNLSYDSWFSCRETGGCHRLAFVSSVVNPEGAGTSGTIWL